MGTLQVDRLGEVGQAVAAKGGHGGRIAGFGRVGEWLPGLAGPLG